jgi:PAS domain S-box-containing protein
LIQEVFIVGAPGPGLPERLAEAGIALLALDRELPEGAPVLVCFADPLARAWLVGQEPLLAIALLPPDAPGAWAEDALLSGALDVLDEEDPALVQTLRCAARQGGVWLGRRLREQRELQRAYNELGSTRDLLGRLVENAPVAIVAFDVQGRVLLFNPAAEQMLRYDSATARQQLRAGDLYVDERDMTRLLDQLHAAPNGALHSRPAALRARTGELVPVLFSAAEVYSADGQVRASVHLLVDQRPAQALELRAERAAADVVESERRAATLDEGLRQLLELSQPLMAVTGVVDLLLDGPLEPTARGWLERSVVELERLHEGMRAMGRLSRPRARPSAGAQGLGLLLRDPSTG